MTAVSDDIEQLYTTGQYGEVIRLLSLRTNLSSREAALLGIALLRKGDLTEAEAPLARAVHLGDLEASVEYGNWIRATGRPDEAISYLTELLPRLSDELEHRAQRWIGASHLLANRSKEALMFLEQARKGYMLLGDTLSEAKVLQNLVRAYQTYGDVKKAVALMTKAVNTFRTAGFKTLLTQGLANLIQVRIQSAQISGIDELMEELESLIVGEPGMQHVQFWETKVNLHQLRPMGRAEFMKTVDQIIETCEHIGLTEHLLYGLIHKIDFFLESDQLSAAMQTVYQAPQDEYGQFAPNIRVARALINRRMGNLREAIEELTAVIVDLEVDGDVRTLARARLQLAYAHYLDDQLDEAAAVLRVALQGLLRTPMDLAMRPELEELSELLHFASLDPSLAPYLVPVMDRLTAVLVDTPSDQAEHVRLQVQTLGRTDVLRNGDQVMFQLKGTLPLLVYLTLNPGRTRGEIQQDLYPDREPETGSAYVRKGLQELREVLGPQAVLTEGPRNTSRYRLGPELQVSLDFTRFQDAVERSEVPKALALYKGEFLPGYDDSEWILQQREAAQLALTFELQRRIDAAQEAHEWRRVILLAGHYLRIDPHDPAVHEARVEAARRVGTASELGKFVAALNASLK